jgi:hypothetical protein
MNWTSRFVIGLKLLGVYCLLQGLEGIARDTPQQLKILNQWGQLHGVFKISALVSMMIPFIMAAVGLYVIRYGMPRQGTRLREATHESSTWAALGITLFGFYLLIRVLPDILRMIPDLLIVLQAPAYVSRDGALHLFQTNLFSSSLTVMLGIACVFRGEVAAMLALKHISSKQKAP